MAVVCSLQLRSDRVWQIQINCLDVLNDVCHLVPPQTWSKKNHSLLRQQGKTNGFLGSPLDPHWNSNRQSGRWIAGPLKTVPGWRWRRKAHHETKAKGKETGVSYHWSMSAKWSMMDVWCSPPRKSTIWDLCAGSLWKLWFFWDLELIKEIVEKVIETEIDHDNQTSCCSQLLTFEETESTRMSEGFPCLIDALR